MLPTPHVVVQRSIWKVFFLRAFVLFVRDEEVGGTGLRRRNNESSRRFREPFVELFIVEIKLDIDDS